MLARFRRFTLRTAIVVVFALSVVLAFLRWQATNRDRRLTRIEELGGAILRVDSVLTIPSLPYPYDQPFERLLWVDFSNRGDELYPPLPGRVSDQDLPFIATFRHIEWLGLSNCRISDDGVNHIAGMRGLKELSLAFTDVTDEGVAILAHMDLDVLDLDHTRITDHAMDSVATLCNLQNLSIRGTRVTDAGLRSLGRLRNLQLIELGETNVTDDGISYLQTRFTSLCVVR
jgi:hypothetical protein